MKKITIIINFQTGRRKSYEKERKEIAGSFAGYGYSDHRSANQWYADTKSGSFKKDRSSESDFKPLTVCYEKGAETEIKGCGQTPKSKNETEVEIE